MPLMAAGLLFVMITCISCGEKQENPGEESGEETVEIMDSLEEAGIQESAEETDTAGKIPYEDEIAAIAAASVGDIVYFGSYEQDNDTANGTEPVEWYVLDKADGEVTLLSVYLLAREPYNKENTNITWEDCTLRSWLNDEFYNETFSEKEQAAIVNTDVVNEDNPFWDTEGGSDTVDKVWLLSLGEVEKYFGIPMTPESDPLYNNTYIEVCEYAIYYYEQDSRVCAEPTAYLAAKGGSSYSEEDAQYYLDNFGYDTSFAVGSGVWWLRSPGDDSYSAVIVTNGSIVYNYGSPVDYFNCVRPALKVAY